MFLPAVLWLQRRSLYRTEILENHVNLIFEIYLLDLKVRWIVQVNVNLHLKC